MNETNKPEIKIRYQLSKNYQVVEVEANVPSDKVSTVAPQLLALAKGELAKIENVGETKTTTYSKPASNSNYSGGVQQDPNAIAINSKGYKATSSDKVELTNAEVAKVRSHKLQYWTITKAEIDRLA